MARKKAATRAPKKITDSDRLLAAAFAYLLTIASGLVVYYWKPKDDYVHFHAAQSILFFVLWFVIGVVLSIITAPLWLIPFIGWSMLGIISLIYWVAALVSWLYLMYAALTGQKYEYPIIGKYAKRW